MTALAAACGILIVVLGFWSTGRSPTEAQSVIEIVCLVGGLILCFLAVLLSRLAKVSARLDELETPGPEATPTSPAVNPLAGENEERTV